MNDKTISLCLSYANYKNPDYQILFRIADYNPNTDTIYAIPFSDEKYADTPKMIGAHPKELTSNMTVFRKWDYDIDDPSKTRSYEYNANIYEVIYPAELCDIEYSDTTNRRKVLCQGFSINDNVSDNILIAIGKNGTHNAVLYCRKRNLRKIKDGFYAISSNTNDMLHSTHFLNEYDISDSNIINSSNCNISLPNGKKAPIRYFYNSTNLPESTGIFHTIDFIKYIPAFISNYFRKNKSILQFSSNDIRKIVNIIESIFDNKEYIDDFFKYAGYSNEMLSELLLKYKQAIIDNLLENSSIDEIIQQCLLKDPQIYERYITLVKEAWLSEKSEEKERILVEIKALKNQYEKLKTDIISKATEEQLLNAEIEKAQKDLTSQREQLTKIKEDIELELKEFSNNIVHNTALCSIAQSVCRPSDENKSTPVNLITLEPNAIDENEELDDYDDFQDALADNLIAIGYDGTVSDEMAQLISYSISAQLPILLTANEDEIAKCIAAMFSTFVSVINIGIGIDTSDIISSVKGQSNKVILIHGAFSGLSAEFFNSIRYHLTDDGYVLLFSLDSIDAGSIPKTIYEKSMYLECGSGFLFPQKSKIKSYNTKHTIFEKEYSKEDFLIQRKKLDSFVDNGIINSVAASNYAKYMVDIRCNIKKDWLVLLQICVQAKAGYKSDTLKDILTQMDIDVDFINHYF